VVRVRLTPGVPERVLHLGGGGPAPARLPHHARPARQEQARSPTREADTRIPAVTTRAALTDVIVFGVEPVVPARLAGNVILLGGNVPMIEAGKHECVIDRSDLPIFTGGALPLLDEPGRAPSGRLRRAARHRLRCLHYGEVCPDGGLVSPRLPPLT
jgi:hypothetical protein